MSRERLADAYDNLAEAYAQVAHELRGSIEPPVARAGVPDSVPAENAAGGPPPPAASPTESAFTRCPAHDKPWVDGRFGPFCTIPSTDPEWSNDKGFCRVTPKNAAAWLRDHPRAA